MQKTYMPKTCCQAVPIVTVSLLLICLNASAEGQKAGKESKGAPFSRLAKEPVLVPEGSEEPIIPEKDADQTDKNPITRFRIFDEGQDAASSVDEALRYGRESESISQIKPAAAYKVPYGKWAMIGFDTFVEYNSNVFKTKDGTKQDYILHLAPEARFSYGNPNNNVIMSYRVDQRIYNKFNVLTNLEQAGGFELNLFQEDLIRVKVRDRAGRTQQPATAEIIQYIDRVPNYFFTEIKYDFTPKATLGFQYNQELQHYLSSAYRENSYFKNVYTPLFEWHYSEKTSLFAGNDFGFVDYYEGHPDFGSDYYEPFTGARVVFNPKLSCLLRGGYQARKYRTKKLADKGILSGPTFVAEARWSPSQNSSLSAVVTRYYPESISTDYANYPSTTLFLNLNQNVLSNFLARVSAHIGRSDYPVDTFTRNEGVRRQHNTTYGIRNMLIYFYQRNLSIYMGYEFVMRDSNIRSSDYKYSIVSGGAKLEF